MSQPLLSAKAIFAAADIQHEVVDVPEWGGSIRLQQMNAEEATQFGEVMTRCRLQEETKNDGMYLMLVYSARTEDGGYLFTEADVPELRKKSIDVLNMLQRKALTLNKMGPAEQAALKKD